MKHVAAFCKKWDMLPEGGLVLCAVSGGRDSVALLDLLHNLSAQEGFSLAAAHYNHHLRPTADRDEQFVRQLCQEKGIPFSCGSGDVASYAKEAGRSIEDAARVLRYQFLEETADRLGAVRIATAHHRQDNAETVLLHLLRGTGLQGLTGIPPVRGMIIRPLLETDRSEIDQYIRDHNLPFVEDETNCDTAYSRNRLRLEILPALEELSPGCTGRIAAAAQILRRDNDHLQREAESLLPPYDGNDTVSIDIPLLRKQDDAMAFRLVRLMAHRLGCELTAAQAEAVLSLGSGGNLDLPENLRAIRYPHRLTICRRKEMPASMVLHMGQQAWGAYVVEMAEGGSTAENTVLLSATQIAAPISIGLWDGSGRLAVENGSRTIKRLFSDRGIPVAKRHEHPALYLNGTPIALFGVATDCRYLPADGEPSLVITLNKSQ